MDKVGAAAHSGRNGAAGASAVQAPSRRGAHELERPRAPVQVRIDGQTAAPASAYPGEAVALGNVLRLARLAQRLTLTQVSAATRIQTAYLEAIEDDDYALLPSPLHARAFVHSYARYLATRESTRDPRAGNLTAQEQLDPDALVALYERQHRPRAPHRIVRTGRRHHRFSWLRLAGTGAALVLGVLVIVLLINPSWFQLRPSFATLPGVRPGATPTTLGSGPTGVGLDSPRLPGEAVGGTAVASDSGVVVRAEATEGVWVRVTIDGQLAQEGLLAVGERALWSGKQSVHIRSGNARALSLVVNGQDLGPLGTQDEVIERTFLPADRN